MITAEEDRRTVGEIEEDAVRLERRAVVRYLRAQAETVSIPTGVMLRVTARAIEKGHHLTATPSPSPAEGGG